MVLGVVRVVLLPARACVVPRCVYGESVANAQQTRSCVQGELRQAYHSCNADVMTRMPDPRPMVLAKNRARKNGFLWWLVHVRALGAGTGCRGVVDWCRKSETRT